MWKILTAALIIVGLVSGCGGGSSKSTPAPTPSISATVSSSPVPQRIRTHGDAGASLNLFLGCSGVKGVLVESGALQTKDAEGAAESFKLIPDPIAQNYASLLYAAAGDPSQTDRVAAQALVICRASHAFKN